MPQSPNSGFKLYFPEAPTAAETLPPVKHARHASPSIDDNSMSNALRQFKAKVAEQCGWQPDGPEPEHDDIAGQCAEIRRTPRPEEACGWQRDPPERVVDDINDRCEPAQILSLPEERYDLHGDRPDLGDDELGRIRPPTQQGPSPKDETNNIIIETSPDPGDGIAAPEPKRTKSLLERTPGGGDKRKSAPEVPKSALGLMKNFVEAKPIPGTSQDDQTTGTEQHAEESFQDVLNRSIRQAFGVVLEKIRNPTPPPVQEQPDDSNSQPQPSHTPPEPTTHMPPPPPPQLSQPGPEPIPTISVQKKPSGEPKKVGKSKKNKAIEKEERAKAKKAKEEAKKEKAKAEREQKAKDKKEKERLKHEKQRTKKEREKERKERERREKKREKSKASSLTPPELSHRVATSPTSGSAVPHPRCEMCKNNEGIAYLEPIKELMGSWQNLPSFAELAVAAKRLIGRKDSKVTIDAPAAENEEHAGHDPQLVEHVVDHIAEHVYQRLGSDSQSTAAQRYPCGKLVLPGKEHTCDKQCSPASHGLDGNRDSPTQAEGKWIIRSPTRKCSSTEESVVRSPSGFQTPSAIGTPIDRARSPWNQRLGLKTSPPYSSHIRSPMRGPPTPYPPGFSREAAFHHHFCVPVMPMISSLCLETRCPYDLAPTPHFPGSGADIERAPTVNLISPGLAETLPSHSPRRTPSPNGYIPTLRNTSENDSDTPRAMIGRHGSSF
ncbi:hypothetical protein F5X99DRAFT_418823 [Biscogniauxia marginata]|nr:hypothetical protein F5X99DRAFT_418823 [Biscogniauxia marginata]